MKKTQFLPAVLLLALVMFNCKQPAKPDPDLPVVSTPDARIIATVYNSGFEHSHDTYNGLSSASDGRIYYVLCSELMEVACQMYGFDPKTGQTEHLGDLTEICSEKGMNVVAQGKRHVNFVESNGKLYFATHLGITASSTGWKNQVFLRMAISHTAGGISYLTT